MFGDWCRHVWKSLGFSWQGLVACFRDEIAFRQEFALAVVHVIAVVLFPFSMWVRIVLTLLLGLIFVSELLNTAIEATVDMVSQEQNDLAKKAKDCASAAVFCAISMFILGWIIAFVQWLIIKN